MKHLLLLALMAGPASAASITETWSGAGPTPCLDRCSIEWAATHLTDDERAQLEAVRARQPDPEFIPVDDGTTFLLMTYYKERPIAYRTTTLAVLDAPEGSWGWQMDGWSFVKLTACGNWSIIRGRVPQPVTYGATPSQPSSAAILPVATVLTPTPVGPTPWTPVVTPEPPVEPPSPSPVPLPGAAWMLVAGLIGLAFVGQISRSPSASRNP